MNMPNIHPPLRFKDDNGKNFPDWEVKKLSQISTLSKGKGISKSDIDQDGNTPCIRYGELYTQYNEIIQKVESRTLSTNNKNLIFSQGNEVLIPSSGETAIDIATAAALSIPNIAIGGDINIIRPDSRALNTFLAYSLNGPAKRRISQLAQGSSVIHLYGRDLKSLSISLPSLPEQQKIAHALSQVDALIQATRARVTHLQHYKKGMMQQLFSQQLRFKDDNGNDFPDWERKKSEKLFKNHSNKKHNGDLPVLSASQEKGMIYRKDSGIDIQASEASVKSYKIVEPGDFVITLRSFQGGIDYSDKLGICSPAYIVLKPVKPIIDKFYQEYFKKESYIERLSKSTIGIRDGKQIPYSSFGGISVPYPSLPEQQKIADCLTAIDREIVDTQHQADQLQHWKKGLMQQLVA